MKDDANLAVASGEQITEQETAAVAPNQKDHWQWTGEGPEPAKWTAADGTLVYRSYEDYCDD